MKIFNYACTNKDCNNFFEAFVKTSDQKVPCEKCGSETEKRLTMPTFTFKGEGFFGRGTFSKSHEGPKIDQELLRLDDVSLNRELGLPDDCA